MPSIKAVFPLDEKLNSLFFFLQWGQDDWCPLSSDEGFCKSYLGSRMHFYTSVWISCLKRSFFCGLFSLAGWWWWGCCPQCSIDPILPSERFLIVCCFSLGVPCGLRDRPHVVDHRFGQNSAIKDLVWFWKRKPVQPILEDWARA